MLLYWLSISMKKKSRGAKKKESYWCTNDGSKGRLKLIVAYTREKKTAHMLSIHCNKQIWIGNDSVVTDFFYSGCLFSRNYFSSFALALSLVFFVFLSMTPDDKRDLIMPSLDRRTKRRSLSSIVRVMPSRKRRKRRSSSSSRSKRKRRRRRRRRRRRCRKRRREKNKVSFLNLKRRWKKQCETHQHHHHSLSGDFYMKTKI